MAQTLAMAGLHWHVSRGVGGAAMAGLERPWAIVVRVDSTQKPVRVFDKYLTENDANGFADVLRSQAKQNGWAHKITVEKYDARN